MESVVAEPRGGAHHNPEVAAASVGDALAEALAELDGIPPGSAVAGAASAFSELGRWSDPELPPGTLSLFGGYTTG